MANNELDAILAEIRKKAQETEAATQKAEEESLPVDVVETPGPSHKVQQNDIFSDILKAVGAAEEKKAAAPKPEPAPEPEATPEPEAEIKAEAEPAPSEEAPAPESPFEEAPAVKAAEEELVDDPTSIFTFTDDEPKPSALPQFGDEDEEEAEEAATKVIPTDVIAGEAADEDTADDADAEEEPEKGEFNKKPVIIALVCLIVVAALVGVYFGFFHHKKPAEETTESQPAVTESVPATAVTAKSGGIVNPLTGEPDYNEAAVGKRPVAVVVENEYSTKAIRPQWGIEDPDMIMEAETEFSTRMLFFWADYTDVPEKVGPTRSARPPFIHFAQLYDAVYIHAGLSHSKGDYVGADSVFENEGIDHINLLSYEENGTYIGRDKSRTSTIEHTGYLNGTNAAELIEKQGFRTELDTNRLTQFEFNEEAQATGTMDAKTVNFIWSSNCPKHAKFTFDEKDGVYRTSDFDEQGRTADLKFETLMMMLDETVYVKVENYKGTGNSETYCNYNLSGGKCLIASEGKASECTWSVENGKIVIKDESGKPIKLNPGKIYIGYGSSNNGGSYSVGESDSSN